jgi:hypothetical protein
MFYKHTLYSLQPPPETGVLILILLLLLSRTRQFLPIPLL